jgi:hypothetical protein
MRIALLALLIASVAGCGSGPTRPAPASTPFTVTVVAAEVRAGVAHVEWEVTPRSSGSLLVQRQLRDAPWKGLVELPISPQGRLGLEDSSVQPGAAYRYRLRLPDHAQPGFAGEVAIEVPEP